jgi:malic enzyme
MTEQRICIVGAGSAGLGVGVNVLQALKREGLSTEEAADRFWVVDQYGLMGKGREELSMHQVGQRLYPLPSAVSSHYVF